MDVAVSPVITDAVEEAVALEQLADRWLHPGEAQGHPGLLGELDGSRPSSPTPASR